RRVRHHRRRALRGVDFSRVSTVWFDRADDAPSGHTHLRVWIRGTRRPHRVRDVPETTNRRTTANGHRQTTVWRPAEVPSATVARVPQVGRPLMVGVTTLSPSQRGAYEPEYPLTVGESRSCGGSA